MKGSRWRGSAFHILAHLMSQPQLYEVGVTISFIVFYFKMFIYLHQVLVAACGIFSCAMRPLNCAMWGLVT